MLAMLASVWHQFIGTVDLLCPMAKVTHQFHVHLSNPSLADSLQKPILKSLQGLLGWVLLYLIVPAAIPQCQNIQRTHLLVIIAVQQLLHA